VAGVTLAPESTLVTIVRGVAPAAAGGRGIASLAMTSRTGDIRMHAVEAEVGLLTVIELPQRPTIGGVAAVARRTQPTVVCIVGQVTRIAGTWRIGKAVVGVTGNTGRHAMHSLERKTRELVIEAGCIAPLQWTVAGCTVHRR